MAALTETITEAVGTLRLRPAEAQSDTKQAAPASAPSVQSKSIKPRWYSETANDENRPEYKYKAYLPTFDGHLKLPPLELFEHSDPGLQALNDPDPQSFLRGADVEAITPDFGSEVDGVKLDELDTRGRQQLALYVAQRGVVVCLSVLVNLSPTLKLVRYQSTGLQKSGQLHRQGPRLAHQ